MVNRPATPRMGGRIFTNVRWIERVVVLPGVNGHVLRTVVGVDALDVGHQADERHIAD